MTFLSLTRRTIMYLLFETKTSRSEFGLGLLAFNWGFWLLLPADTFGSSHTFSAMAQMAPEWVWGTGFLLVGVLQMHFGTQYIRGGGAYWNTRYRISVAATAVWTFTMMMFARANFWTTATVIYFSIALVSMSIAVSLSRRVQDG